MQRCRPCPTPWASCAAMPPMSAWIPEIWPASFREEAGKSSVRQDYTWLKPVERGRFSGGALLLVSLAIAGAAYVAWYYRTADARKPAAAVEIVRIQPAPPGDVAAADAGGSAVAPDPGGEAIPPQSALPERNPEGDRAEEGPAEEDRGGRARRRNRRPAGRSGGRCGRPAGRLRRGSEYGARTRDRGCRPAHRSEGAGSRLDPGAPSANRPRDRARDPERG